MVVLVDTNVIIDYLVFRSLPNIWYILRKKPDHIRREMLKQVCDLLSVVSTEHDAVVEAIEAAEFKDFEDCLQDKCAVAAKADYIVTRNAADYRSADTKVITPDEFCKLAKGQFL